MIYKLQVCIIMLIAFYYVENSCCNPIIRKKNKVLVVSLEGMQSAKFEKFLKDNPNCAFNRLIKNGIKADYMIPTFPASRYPSHYTLVTGLYAESHGIIGSSAYDAKIDQTVDFSGGAGSLNAQWWTQAEPIWMTAREQGFKTAASFWTGSEVLTRTPDAWKSYSSSYPDKQRIDEVVNWIYKFNMDLTFLYFNQPYSTGITSGPDSTTYMTRIRDMDVNIEYLISRLEDLDIYNDVNIILLSGTGMATMKTSGTIVLKDYFDIKWINTTRSVIGSFSNIYPLPGYETQVYNELKKIPNIQVYNKNEIPARFNYRSNDRIAPILAIADEGYIMNLNANDTRKGNQGFDNTLESMRTIFVASGPNFKINQKLSSFENVDVYPLICKVLQINCKPNNGTLDTFSNVLQLVPV